MILPCGNPKQPAEQRITYQSSRPNPGSSLKSSSALPVQEERSCFISILLFLQAFFRFTSLPISMITANTIRYQKFSILCPTRQA